MTPNAPSANAGSANAGSANSANANATGTGSAAHPQVPMAVIVLDSVPPGAEVFGPDKASYGKTPARLSLPISDMPLEFELRLAGYRKKTKQLVVSGKLEHSTVVRLRMFGQPNFTRSRTAQPSS